VSDLQFQLGVYFPSREAATIVVSSNQLPAREHLFGCLLTFTNYAMRTLSNLGKSEITDGLASSLAGMTEAHLLAIAKTDTLGGVRLTSSTEVPKGYDKAFTCHLNASVDRGVPRLRFDYSYTGFGWLGRGLGFYAPMSVLALLWNNAKHVGHLPGVAAMWAEAASGIARLHYAGKIGLGNQRELALAVTTLCGQEITPDEWLTVLPPG
jgi:hypothetical protein